MHVAPLLETLSLARTREGFCAPNPSVGAVVVRAGEIIARGCHFAAGHPHAEVEALKNVSDLADCTLYVSLEPCSHTGKRTPPCAQMLIERGVKRVVFAYLDPNPQVAGRGAALLREAGVECLHLPLPEIDAFYEPYAHWTRTHRPFTTAKLALTLDGKIGLDDLPVAITGESLQQQTHLARRNADAILTTARTVRADDPALNSRLDPEAPVGKPLYVLDARAETPVEARIFQTASEVTIFVQEPNARATALAEKGARIVVLPAEGLYSERLSLPAALERIGADGRHTLWIEAGGRLFQSLHEQALLQRALLYVAPKWLGEQGVPAFRAPASDLFSDATSIAWRGQGRDAVCEVTF